MTRLIADLASIKNWVGRGIAEGAVNATALATFICVALAFASEAAIAIATVALASAVLIGVSAFPLRRAIRKTRRARGALATEVGEAVLIAPTLRMFAGVDAEKRRIYRRSNAVADSIAKRWWWATLARRSPECAAPLGIAWLFTVAPVADAAAGAVLLTGAAAAMRMLAQAFDYRLNYLEGSARLAEGLASSGSVAEPWVEEGPVGLVAENARLSLGDRRSTFEIPGGARASVGASAQTTAFMGVVAGLHAPANGSLFLTRPDGRRRRSHSTSRAAILVSPAAPFRRGSAYSNIRDAAPEASDDRIRDIAARCDLLRGGETAAEGLAWRISEGGSGLDSSRAARLRLARAIAANCGLLLIDDPVFEIDAAAMLALQRVAEAEDITMVVAVYGDEAPVFATSQLLYEKRRFRFAEPAVEEREKAA